MNVAIILDFGTQNFLRFWSTVWLISKNVHIHDFFSFPVVSAVTNRVCRIKHRKTWVNRYPSVQTLWIRNKFWWKTMKFHLADTWQKDRMAEQVIVTKINKIHLHLHLFIKNHETRLIYRHSLGMGVISNSVQPRPLNSKSLLMFVPKSCAQLTYKKWLHDCYKSNTTEAKKLTLLKWNYTHYFLILSSSAASSTFKAERQLSDG